jgi:hypothetical protein
VIRRILIVCGLLVLVAPLSGCIRISGELPSTAATPTPAPAKAKPVTVGVVGEKLTMGPWTVTLEDAARTSSKVGAVKPSAGSEFLTLGVGFENKGTDALEVRVQDFALIDQSGVSMPLAKVQKPAFNASSMRPLLPRYGTSTVFVYQVPAGSARYTFAFRPPGQKTRLEWRVP